MWQTHKEAPKEKAMGDLMKSTTKNERQHQLNRELHAAFQDGDPAALGELIKINKGLCSIPVRKYKWVLKLYRDIELVDLDQAAMIGLWQAAINWDPDRGVLSTLVFWYSSREIQKMIWKRQRCREDKVLLSETSTFEPIPGTENLKVEDYIKDEAALPDELAASKARCEDFFQKLEELNPMPADMEALKDFVYRDWPPKDPKTFQRVKQLIRSNTRNREWVRDWLDHHTTFISSQAFDSSSGRRGDGGYSDPTAQTVIHRERLENRLERLLEGVH